MTLVSKVSIALTGAIFVTSPNAGAALQSRFPAQIATIAATCAQPDNTGSTACLNLLLPYLSRLRATTSGLQYDTEIAAIALALVQAYEQLGNAAPGASQTLGQALAEIGKSAADPGQAARIGAIAASVTANQGLENGLNRLLASPN